MGRIGMTGKERDREERIGREGIERKGRNK
jgi:hypothetical protein